MSGDLGGSQLSSLLEAVPGLASVLRSPVADAMVNVIRAAAGLGDFYLEDVRELVQYATRRGLIPSMEGAQLLEEVEAVAPKRRRGKRPGRARAVKKKAVKKKVSKVTPKQAKKASKRSVVKKKTTSPRSRSAKKGAARTAKRTPKRRR